MMETSKKDISPLSGRVFLNNTPELQTEISVDCILNQTFEKGSDKVGESYSMRYLDTSRTGKRPI